MVIFLFLIIFIVGILAFYNTERGKNLIDFIRFCKDGRKKGFSFKHLMLLWKINAVSNKNAKAHFFSSIASLDFCIKMIQKEIERSKKNKRTEESEILLTKLYAWRTKFELELMQNQNYINTTYDMEEKQVCMLLSKKVGSIYIRCEEVKDDYIRFIMFDSSAAKASQHNWQNDYAQVYFWRKYDAGYFYISKVLRGMKIKDGYEMHLAHSNDLKRIQKRKSIRASCRFNAVLYPLHSKFEFNDKYEKTGGIKCIVKNICEDGAMIYIKGKAEKGVNIKLQFKINNKNIVMCGLIVRFLYDEKSNMSKIHFSCSFIKEKHRNRILSFVYNIAEAQNHNIASSLFEEEKDEVMTAGEFNDVDSSKLDSIENINEFIKKE